MHFARAFYLTHTFWILPPLKQWLKPISFEKIWVFLLYFCLFLSQNEVGNIWFWRQDLWSWPNIMDSRGKCQTIWQQLVVLRPWSYCEVAHKFQPSQKENAKERECGYHRNGKWKLPSKDCEIWRLALVFPVCMSYQCKRFIFCIFRVYL